MAQVNGFFSLFNSKKIDLMNSPVYLNFTPTLHIFKGNLSRHLLKKIGESRLAEYRKLS